jgi:hypothetical protein
MVPLNVKNNSVLSRIAFRIKNCQSTLCPHNFERVGIIATDYRTMYIPHWKLHVFSICIHSENVLWFGFSVDFWSFVANRLVSTMFTLTETNIPMPWCTIASFGVAKYCPVHNDNVTLVFVISQNDMKY